MHVQEIVAASGLKAANIRVLLTGHSLGGALAGLAAHDLVTHCGLTNCQVTLENSVRHGFVGSTQPPTSSYSCKC